MPEPGTRLYWAAGTYSSRAQTIARRPAAIKRLWVLPANPPPHAAISRDAQIVELQRVAHEVRKAIERLREEGE